MLKAPIVYLEELIIGIDEAKWNHRVEALVVVVETATLIGFSDGKVFAINGTNRMC